MNPAVRIEGGQLVIDDDEGIIKGRHRSQLAYWGFAADAGSNRLVASPVDVHATLDKVLSYLTRHNIAHDVTEEVAASKAALVELRSELNGSVVNGARFKAGKLSAAEFADFLAFVAANIPRKLKEHQLKAALHLLTVTNGANFSVPGSGKTTVVLAVFAWLRSRGLVDALFVVGPPACFGPWRTEYEAVLGVAPRAALLAGGDIQDRHGTYAGAQQDLCDLYLTTFQTLQRDWGRVRILFREAGAQFFLVVDEAHYIKQLGGAWASAVLSITQDATRRCVLTGTPFPRTYSDAFNLFDVLWPRSSPLPQAERIKIEYLAQKYREDEATQLLSSTIGPLFYRVRKSELQLAEQRFGPPVIAEMGVHERRVHDAIIERVRALSMDDYLRDIDLLMRLRRGRMMRLRQTVSYARLLGSAVLEYNENLTEGDLSLADVIRHYDELEVPGKITILLKLLAELRSKGERKVVVWSNFVGTLQLIRQHLEAHGYGVGLIYGETPTESTPLNDERSREEIIATFVDSASGVDILVANPAACAESISLHKTCSHAVYYDMSYNCAQYLQSLDRIHRVGGSENKIAHYHFLQYAGTVDQDLLSNVQAKARRMSAIIDQDYPVYSLDMFAVDDELEAYERLFR
jgi:superfamily II DNA or RNA helicase